MIRELHVYGRVNPVGYNKTNGAQHIGIGTELIRRAENIARYNNYNKIAVISGIGVREYYRKKGYALIDTYMVKNFKTNFKDIFILPLLFIIIAYIFKYFVKF